MAHLIPFDGKEPQVAPSAFIAPTAVLIGDVVVEERASVWFGAVLRGDFNRIVVGEGSSIQDNSVLHTAVDVPTTLGSNVTVGHLCMIEACTIGDGALVGMGSIVLNRARVGERAMLAAGSVVRQDDDIPPEVLAVGVPAQVRKDLTEAAFERMKEAAHEYQALRLRYMDRAGHLASEVGKGDG